MPVLDLLIRDESNPRALMFQAKGLHDYLEKMEVKHGPCGREKVYDAMQMMRDLDISIDYTPDSEKFHDAINAMHSLTFALTDSLTNQFFTHPRSQSDWSSPWL